MKPLQMTFRHIDPDTDVELAIRAEADALYRDLPAARGCDVTVDRPHKQAHDGARCYVRVALSVPGVHLVAESDAADSSPTAITAALRDAFDTVRARGLARRQRLGRVERRALRRLVAAPSAA